MSTCPDCVVPGLLLVIMSENNQPNGADGRLAPSTPSVISRSTTREESTIARVKTRATDGAMDGVAEVAKLVIRDIGLAIVRELFVRSDKD
jgi:hypothetical protein